MLPFRLSIAIFSSRTAARSTPSTPGFLRSSRAATRLRLPVPRVLLERADAALDRLRGGSRPGASHRNESPAFEGVVADEEVLQLVDQFRRQILQRPLG